MCPVHSGFFLFGAQLARSWVYLRVRFAFAPAMLQEAVDTYRANFKPSEHLEQPYVMVGATAMLADTDEQARYLYTTSSSISWVWCEAICLLHLRERYGRHLDRL